MTVTGMDIKVEIYERVSKLVSRLLDDSGILEVDGTLPSATAHQNSEKR